LQVRSTRQLAPTTHDDVFYLSCGSLGAWQVLPGSDKPVKQDNAEIRWNKIMEALKRMKQTRCHGKK